MLSRLFIAALWSPAGKGLTSWLLFVMSNWDFVTFPCGILGQVWYLIVLISERCRLSDVNSFHNQCPLKKHAQILGLLWNLVGMLILWF